MTRAFRDLSVKFSPGLVFLPETRLAGAWTERIKGKMEFANRFMVDSIKKSRAYYYFGMMVGM